MLQSYFWGEGNICMEMEMGIVWGFRVRLVVLGVMLEENLSELGLYCWSYAIIKANIISNSLLICH